MHCKYNPIQTVSLFLGLPISSFDIAKKKILFNAKLVWPFVIIDSWYWAYILSGISLCISTLAGFYYSTIDFCWILGVNIKAFCTRHGCSQNGCEINIKNLWLFWHLQGVYPVLAVFYKLTAYAWIHEVVSVHMHKGMEWMHSTMYCMCTVLHLCNYTLKYIFFMPVSSYSQYNTSWDSAFHCIQTDIKTIFFCLHKELSYLKGVSHDR